MDEELLSLWLRLTSLIDNQRLAAGGARPELPFNQAVVCSLLARAQETGSRLTASDLCRQTRILKSQMNAILSSLEARGVISRSRSRADRRRVELQLLPEGLERFQAGHRRVLAMVDRLIGEMGEERVRQLIPLLRQAADIFENILEEA